MVINNRRELSDFDSDNISLPSNKKKKKDGGRVLNQQLEKNPKPVGDLKPSAKWKSLRLTTRRPPSSFSLDDDNEDPHKVCPSTSKGRRGIKKFNCDICGRCCTSKRCAIAQHINTHTVEKPFICDQCPMTFSFHSNFRRQRQNDLPSTHKCDFCCKMFAREHNRDTHMNTHTREKPFDCEQCDEIFAQSAGLIQHQQMHHSTKPKYKICEKMLKTNSYRKTHSAPQLDCQFCKKEFTNHPIYSLQNTLER